MNTQHLKPLQERTDAKLRYARVHLNQLHAQPAFDGGDFDKAHQESFLFHLLGTRDALLAEINEYYQAALPLDGISLGKLRNAIRAQGRESPELAAMYALEQEKDSWYSLAKSFRDHSAHIQGVKRAYFLGGKDDGMVKLKHPATGEPSNVHLLADFEHWHASMIGLVAQLRASAKSDKT